MNATEVLLAIRLKHWDAALLPECVIQDGRSSRRIDALMFKTRVRTAIEVKVSVADFKRETDAKRDPWWNVVHRFVYATPEGLLDPSMIPTGCGLWEVGVDGSLRIAKRAVVNKKPKPLPDHFIQALAYRAQRNN